MKRDSHIRCRHCGTQQRVNFGQCLRSGWPECCGETMMLIATKADVYEETAGIIRTAVAVSKTEQGDE